jgi:hypothetical protein
MTRNYFDGMDAVYAAAGLLEKEAARRETKILRSLLKSTEPSYVNKAAPTRYASTVAETQPSAYAETAAAFPGATAPQTPLKKTRLAPDRIQAGASPDKANQLLATMQQRGYSPREYVGHLGTGGEGIADLVAHKGQLVARKTYNPDSAIYSPKGVRRKEQIMQASQRRFAKEDNPLTELYGAKTVTSPVTGKEYRTHYTEYVPHAQTGGNTHYDEAALRRSLDRAHPGFRSEDFADTWQRSSHGNNIAVTADGRSKVVDFIPTRPSDGVYSPQTGHGIHVEEGAANPKSGYFPNLQRAQWGGPTPLTRLSSSASDMRAYMHRGEIPVKKVHRQGPRAETVPAPYAAHTEALPAVATAVQRPSRRT